MPKQGSGSSIDDLERNTGKPNSINIAFENGGHTIPPSRKYKYETLASQQTLDIVWHKRSVRLHAVISDALRTREYRLKLLLIEVTVVHLVSGLQ
jgi:hypothetical protein